MLKNITIFGLIIAIVIGWSAMAKASSNDLDGYDVYLRNQNDASDIFLFNEPLYTVDDLKLQFNNGKIEGAEQSSAEIARLKSELDATYARILTLEDESVDNYKCVLTNK